MLTVCCLGCSERGLDSHWLPSCLTQSMLQPTLTTSSTQQRKHKWLHCWTRSKYALLSRLLHASTLCWFSTWNVFRLFSSNGLDHWLGLCREVIERAEYHLHLGYITRIFTFTPALGPLQPPSKKTNKKNRSSLFQCQPPLVCSVSLESGGRIKRQSVFEGTGPWCLIGAIHLITPSVGAAPEQRKSSAANKACF